MTERELTLKCQHCRFLACAVAGMKEEYIQGSLAFGDHRTCRKKSGVDNGGSTGSNLVPPEVACLNSYPIATPLLHSSNDQLIQLIRMFWGRYSYEKAATPAATGWTVPDTAVAKLDCIDHIKDAMHLHISRLTQLLDLLPYTRLMFTPEQKTEIISKCYVEVIVLRWVMTTNADEQSIRGVTGIEYKFDDLWYVQISH